MSRDEAGPTAAALESSGRPTTLRELAWLFAKLGATSFGGPVAHIAMMEEEVVRRRRWLSEEQFLDRLGATNLIPGPNSTELALHIGLERRGLLGLVVAGVAFVAPAALLSAGCGWAYVRFGSLPAVGALLMGVKPVILAIVVQAWLRLVPVAARNLRFRALGLAVLAGAFLGASELVLLVAAGGVEASLRAWRGGEGRGGAPPAMALVPFGGVATAATVASWPSILAVFFKIGSVLFGSGYVLVAFLREELVERRGWLLESQLLDAIAVGQVTPGPVFSTATFIGYLVSGSTGAVAATLGIFLPAFVLVALSGPLVPRLRRSPLAGGFLDGVNVASLALMIAVTWTLARGAIVDATTAALGLVAAVLLVRHEVNATWLVVAGAACGVALAALGLGPG